MAHISMDAQTPSATAGDYFALLKPRVMSLVVFTALVGYLVAPSDKGAVIGFASILAIAIGAGAAGALNMWVDADIDALMKRTRGRPVPSGRVRAEEALGFGVALSILSVLLMALSGGVLAAALLAFTIFFYAVIYSLWLKRATPHNIVIGGLAGALPPLIAWAAAADAIALEPLILVAIIFMWTPPHFWALALYQRGDYAAAGVPMLPVTHGAKATRTQILVYSMLFAPLAVSPAFIGLGGALYAVVSGVGAAIFVALAVRIALSRAGEAAASGQADLYDAKKDAHAARDLFAFSILYLFALFAALLIERALGLFA